MATDDSRSAAAPDLAVIGGGAAGLHVALEAAGHGARVALISRKALAESSSYWAQGGLAAALADDDSPEQHAEDTIAAGRGAARRSAVEVLTAEAPAEIAKLERLGVPFDREPDGTLALALEGGHGRRRIVHAGGAGTGRLMTERLTALAADNPLIDVREGHSALALWSDGNRCAGVITDHGPVRAAATVLATGGAAALWRRTTNPWGAIGAGPVFALAAGARVADVELCQFHPTALASPDERFDGSLITEAVRGEGATLVDVAGERFTDELAPRDAVTLAVLERMEQTGADHVLLDMRGLDPKRFPNVFELLGRAGHDPASEPIPVSPAAHYTLGGVATDLHGRTSLAGLYAVGECACTGLHGANRLASNSLSECFVFGTRVAGAAVGEQPTAPPPDEPKWRFDPPPASTRERVWRCAGPRRRAEQLEELLDDPYPLARMIAAAALQRRESRGVHTREEHPGRDPALDGVHFTFAAEGEPVAERWD